MYAFTHIHTQDDDSDSDEEDDQPKARGKTQASRVDHKELQKLQDQLLARRKECTITKIVRIHFVCVCVCGCPCMCLDCAYAFCVWIYIYIYIYIYGCVDGCFNVYVCVAA